MKPIYSLLLFSALASSAAACSSSGGTCEQAFDKMIECGERSDEARKEMKANRSKAIKSCEAIKDTPAMKAELECAEKSSCDEYDACKASARAAQDVERIQETIATDPGSALQTCSYNIEGYRGSKEFKETCDKAFAAAFANLDDDNTLSDARFACASSSDAKEWLAASPPFREGCAKVLSSLETSITKTRDEGAKADFSSCSAYKDMVKVLSPDKTAQAELLCKEADQADDAKKAMAEVKAELGKKTGARIPFSCHYFLKRKEEFKGSKWFEAKSAELAKACFGDLGKVALGNVNSFCSSEGKRVHEYAAAYKLGESDKELQALLDRTASTCNK